MLVERMKSKGFTFLRLRFKRFMKKDYLSNPEVVSLLRRCWNSARYSVFDKRLNQMSEQKAFEEWYKNQKHEL